MDTVVVVPDEPTQWGSLANLTRDASVVRAGKYTDADPERLVVFVEFGDDIPYEWRASRVMYVLMERGSTRSNVDYGAMHSAAPEGDVTFAHLLYTPVGHPPYNGGGVIVDNEYFRVMAFVK